MCNELTRTGVCSACRSDEQLVAAMLYGKIQKTEKKMAGLKKVGESVVSQELNRFIQFYQETKNLFTTKDS